MNQKNLLHHLFEALQNYRHEREMANENSTWRNGRLSRLARWLLPNGGTLIIALLLILTQNVWAGPSQTPASAVGPSATTVNYQGRLADSSGNPQTDTFGMSFSIWDAASGGNIIWGPESHDSVPVTEGLFNVGLGSKTSGGIPNNIWNGDLYLEITVDGEILTPREQIRSVPIAGMALTVPDRAIRSSMLAPTMQRIAANENLDLTGSLQPVPGATVEIDIPIDSTIFLVATVDFELDTADIALAELHVDGSPIKLGINHPTRIVAGSSGGSSGAWRGTASNNYLFDLPAGTHTLQLMARHSTGTGGIILAPPTGFSYIIFADEN